MTFTLFLMIITSGTNQHVSTIVDPGYKNQTVCLNAGLRLEQKFKVSDQVSIKYICIPK